MVNSHLTVMDPDDRQCLIARSAVQKKSRKKGFLDLSKLQRCDKPLMIDPRDI